MAETYHQKAIDEKHRLIPNTENKVLSSRGMQAELAETSQNWQRT